jgi:hypothetical protein|tara:strand:- start:5 stop:307 length:303 start_codon:yes stop_codon:yes gene_type:complete
VFEVCKKGDVRCAPPITATEDGWIHIVAGDHETFRPRSRGPDVLVKYRVDILPNGREFPVRKGRSTVPDALKKKHEVKRENRRSMHSGRPGIDLVWSIRE